MNLRLTTEVASEARSELLEDYLLFQLQLRQLQGLATAAEFAPAKTQAESGSHGASGASSRSATQLQSGSTIEVAQVEAHTISAELATPPADSATAVMPDEAAEDEAAAMPVAVAVPYDCSCSRSR